MERSEIAILIPALNESKTIFSVIQKIQKFGIPFVIDDGSTDKTDIIAKKAGANLIKHEKVYVLFLKQIQEYLYQKIIN